MKRTAALVPVLAIVLTGCVLMDILLFPFKLLFDVLGGIGSGIGSALDAIAVVEPCEGSRPQSMPVAQVLDDGRVLVSAPSQPDPFRIRFSSPGHLDRVMTWPDDFGDARAAPALAAGAPDAVIRVLLEAAPTR